MPKFIVKIARSETRIAQIEVEAKDADEAHDLGWEQMQDDDSDLAYGRCIDADDWIHSVEEATP